LDTISSGQNLVADSAAGKNHNVGESEKYSHDEDMEDHDIQTKENKEDKEEPTGINETDEQAVTGLDKYADHNIEEATIFVEV